MRRSQAVAADGLREHEELAAVLTDDARAWLARMADVLPPGWVIVGMAVPERAAVVAGPGYPLGVQLIHAPAGPSGVSSARRTVSPARGELPTLAIEYAPW